MLDFRLSDDQRDIVAAVTSTLDREAAAGQESQTHNPKTGQVARFGELGWLGIGLPQACGGAEGTLVDEALISYEYGRALASPDLLSTSLAARIAFLAGDLDWAGEFASGRRAAGFFVIAQDALDERPSDACNLLRLGPAAAYVRLRGSACEVVAATAQGQGTKNRRICLDSEMTLSVENISGMQKLAASGEQGDALAERAMILLSAMLAGTAAASRDLAVSYAKVRKQFGRVIGEFQAIKHHCANMHVRARTSYAQTMHAAMLSSERLGGAAEQAAAALPIAIDAAVSNGETCIQIHGGMGFSAECTAHQYLKRAHLLRIVAGEILVEGLSLFDRLLRGRGRQ